MRYRCLLPILLLNFAIAGALHAQVSFYGEVTVSDLANSPAGDYLRGASAGVLFDGPTVFKKMVISGDIQFRYVRLNGERLTGVTIGPRFSFPIKKIKLTPYGEFTVGFAGYRDAPLPVGTGISTTDDEWQVNGGVVRRLTSRLDAPADYSYAQYGYNSGQYVPKSYSAGVIFHLVKR